MYFKATCQLSSGFSIPIVVDGGAALNAKKLRPPAWRGGFNSPPGQQVPQWH
jgi:hypothetical protein